MLEPPRHLFILLSGFRGCSSHDSPLSDISKHSHHCLFNLCLLSTTSADYPTTADPMNAGCPPPRTLKDLHPWLRTDSSSKRDSKLQQHNPSTPYSLINRSPNALDRRWHKHGRGCPKLFPVFCIPSLTRHHPVAVIEILAGKICVNPPNGHIAESS